MNVRITNPIIPTCLSVLFLCLSTFYLSACDGESDEEAQGGNSGVEAYELRFKRITFDANAYGPAFTYIADMNNDGKLDMLVSHFGPLQESLQTFNLPAGEISIYYQGDTLADWRREVILSRDEGLYLPQEIRVADVDGDGDLDLGVGFGFLICGILPQIDQCGGVLWFEQRAPGVRAKHEVLPPTQRRFYHTTLFTDLDGDGVTDLITVAEDRRIVGGFIEEEAETQWFKGDLTQATRFDPTPRSLGFGLGSLPDLFDVDGDGDLDLVSAEYFANLSASFVWMEQVEAPSAESNGVWQRHIIDDQSGPAIQGSMVENFLGDGRAVLIGSNHTNRLNKEDDAYEGIFMFTPGDDIRQPWQRTQISKGMASQNSMSGQAAPGIFDWNDIDADGDIDLFISGDADPRIFLIEQREGGSFVTHVLDDGIAQAGGIKAVDLNGDGYVELVVNSFEGSEIYLYLQDDQGTYPISELGEADLAQALPEKLPKKAEFSIRYEGLAQGTLRALLFDGDCTQQQVLESSCGAVVQRQDVEGATFPASIIFNDLKARDYTLMVYLDLGATSMDLPGEEDFAQWRSFIPPSISPAPINLDVIDDMPMPMGSPADVTLNINYEGEAMPGFNLVAGFYREEPVSGPPEFPQIQALDQFPVQMTFTQVPGGEYFLYTVLDLPPENTFQPGPEDPIAKSSFFVIDGENITVDVTLALP